MAETPCQQLRGRALHQEANIKGTESSALTLLFSEPSKRAGAQHRERLCGALWEEGNELLCEMLRKSSPPTNLAEPWPLGWGGGEAPPHLTADSAGLHQAAILGSLTLQSLGKYENQDEERLARSCKQPQVDIPLRSPDFQSARGTHEYSRAQTTQVQGLLRGQSQLEATSAQRHCGHLCVVCACPGLEALSCRKKLAAFALRAHSSGIQ